MYKKTHIVLHHTATPQGSLQEIIGGINQAHKRRKFPQSNLGYNIGYHFVIDFFGKVLRTRNDGEIGAHCREQRMNYRSIGISLIGNFQTHRVSHMQQIALTQLLDDLIRKHNIPKEYIKYHGQFKSTKCCGKYLIEKLPELIDCVYKEGTVSRLGWQEAARQWAKTNGVITDFDAAPFNKKQVVWLAEVLRKLKNLN